MGGARSPQLEPAHEGLMPGASGTQKEKVPEEMTERVIAGEAEVQ